MSQQAIVKLLSIWCVCVVSSVLVVMAVAASNSSLLKAAKEGRADKVQTFLAEGADINARDEAGFTALMYAALKGHSDTVRVLLNAGADVNAQDKNDGTALMLAASKGYTDIVRALLVNGAQVNAKNKQAWTALMIAAKLGHADIVRELLFKGADAQAKNEKGQTARMLVDPGGPREREIVHLLAQTQIIAKAGQDSSRVPSGKDERGYYVPPLATQSESLSDPGMIRRYHALVIGINDYTDLPPLKAAVHDAKTVAQLLETEYQFNVRLLLNATRAKMIAAFDDLRATLTEQDSLLIYYAGHGHLDQDADRGYWLPIDAKPDTRVHWLSNADITDTLKAVQARHVLVVVDSCYSGTLTRGIQSIHLKTASDRDTYLARLATKRSRTVLTSGGLEPVLDSGSGEHSVFAQAFMNALRENTDILDGQQLFTKVRRQVVVNARQTPQYDDIRFADHQGGDFVFVRKR